MGISKNEKGHELQLTSIAHAVDAVHTVFGMANDLEYIFKLQFVKAFHKIKSNETAGWPACVPCPDSIHG